ncbi:carboxylesterase/lipase family protein [Saccharopolyspora phatthalungensis]|uniref:Carboxylic ester hydrolase n=1 Tax=Saccharopolyspora phatthalungensis TaxID=664693 RepID=A0A840QHG0_9PSEU|nr:carboxylesterase family protein [Saccharopolyspora phatthalungensis]MBB5159430.1 para-nitrobenzyl esterase [Saccharopolyspora phatthalungensis]
MDDIVAVETGRLRGGTGPDGRTRRFLGIPYAAAPTGQLRWRPPHLCPSWMGVRDAVRMAPSSIQAPPPEKSLYFGGDSAFDEDCLNLNVWTGAAGERGRPVMVWFHYGAYQFGSAANPIYDGEQLARRGVTVVTANHRLGRLGFLAHPALTAESGYSGSGNYGLLDQIEVLRWVQRNIESFGGDPENVTLFGVSAGGNTVHNLMSSPLAAGLFHRAIAQSGPGVSRAFDGPGHPAGPQTLAAGEQAGQELTELLGINSLAKLRALSVEQLNSVMLPRAAGPWRFDLAPGAEISLHIFDAAYPVVDRYVLPSTPLEAYQRGNQHDVPLLVGNVGNEASGLPYLTKLSDYREHLETTFGAALAGAAERLYPAADDRQARSASWELEADRIFVWSTWTAARLHARTADSSVHHYRFLRRPQVPADVIEREYAGAFHAAEVPYVFGTLDTRKWPWTEGDRALAQAMANAWVAFARCGDPNDDGSPGWPVFEEHTPSSMLWDVEPTVGDVTRHDRMDLLDRLAGVSFDTAGDAAVDRAADHSEEMEKTTL